MTFDIVLRVRTEDMARDKGLELTAGDGGSEYWGLLNLSVAVEAGEFGEGDIEAVAVCEGEEA